MPIFLKFAHEEDEYIKSHFGIIKISRIAFKLQRPYDAIKLRCIALGLILPKMIKDSRYCCDDEIEYNLLVNGCTEEEIRQLRGTRTVAFGSTLSLNEIDE